MANISGSEVEAYRAHRMSEGAKLANIESMERLKAEGKIVPFVFHRTSGSEIKNRRKRFATACEGSRGRQDVSRLPPHGGPQP